MPIIRKRPSPGWFSFFLFCPASVCSGKQPLQQPVAADLVQNNQTINFRQQKFTDFFVELQNKHHFTGAELRAIFSPASLLTAGCLCS